MKEITYLCRDLSAGGSQMVAINLATEASKYNYKINFIIFGNDITLLNKIKPNEKITLYTCSNGNYKSGLKYRFETFYNFFKILLKIKPKLVHSHLFERDIIYLYLLLFFRKIKLIHTIHTPGGAYLKQNISDRISILIERFFLTIYKDVILVSVSDEIDFIVKNILKFKKKSNIIYNGINPIFFSNHVEKTFFTNQDQIKIIYPARFQPSKGHIILLNAFSKLILDFQNIKLILVGTGLKENLEKIVLKMNIQDHISIFGATSNMADVLFTSDIGVFPSQYEGHPMALCEMMAVGLPIAASDIKPNIFISENGKGLFLYKSNSDNELYKTLKFIIINSIHAAQIGKRGKELILKNFTSEQMFLSYQIFY
jgi:glycosyltransferase involved in cell wall biosynthesis